MTGPFLLSILVFGFLVFFITIFFGFVRQTKLASRQLLWAHVNTVICVVLYRSILRSFFKILSWSFGVGLLWPVIDSCGNITSSCNSLSWQKPRQNSAHGLQVK